MMFRSILTATAVFGSLAFGQMGPGHSGPRGFGFHSSKVVTGEPYSADVNNSSIKALTDGNSIQRTTTGHVARDSQGRTYSQETITGMWGESGSKTVTFISDPVAGYSYTLNAETKTAVRRPLHVPSAEHAQTERPVNPNVATTDLGTQMVNGVNATGKKITHTIPAGQMGNAQAIVTTNETWLSPDLQVVVSAKRTDPREGVSTYMLNNITRTEPAATLFQIPSDYTTKDAQSFEHGGFDRRQ